MAIGVGGVDPEEMLSRVESQLAKSARANQAQQKPAAPSSGGDQGSGGSCGAQGKQPVDPAAQTAARAAAVGEEQAKKATIPPAPTAAPVDAQPAAPEPATTTPPRDLKRGDRGDDVKALQTKLNENGAHLKVDGIFGPKTQAATKAYQNKNGLKHDGVAGPRTREALKPKTPPTTTPVGGTAPTAPTTPTTPTTPTKPGEVSLAPKSMTEEQKWQHYADIVKANGGTMPTPGNPTVLGIRGIDSNGNKHESTNNRKYDDTFVVLTADHKVQELKGSTHAGQLTSSLVSHVGRVDPGNYDVNRERDKKGNPTTHNGMSYYRVTKDGSGELPGVRDQNNDGHYSAAEQARKTTVNGVLFHVGFQDSPKSIGCMTFPPGEMAKLLARSPNGFKFTLVDGSR